MSADYRHLNRLLEIYTLIQGNAGWTAKKLAEKFKTTTRTIFRDIEVIRSVGIPVNHDPDQKCYTIARDFYMKPLELTFQEALALVTLGSQIHAKHQIPFSHPAIKALAKIRGQLPLPIRNELDLTDAQMSITLAASATQEGFEAYYELVRKALATHTCLRCGYESASNYGQDGAGNGSKNSAPFLLKPYALFFSQRAWYVVGFHGTRDEVRTFKLNRFALMEATSQTYAIPKRFTLERHLGNAWRMIRGNTTYNVVLRFDAKFAETITDTAWHPTQAYEYEDGGSLRWTCTVDGLDEIVWWVLSMGKHCEVLEPSELANRVREEAAGMLALYGGDGQQSGSKITNAVTSST